MTDYYSNHAQAYFEKTADLDSSGFLAPFVRFLSPGAGILDIGCGSGRDLRWLKAQGFQPVGFERSSELADLAQTLSGCPVIQGDFVAHDFTAMAFSAIVLCGAFVHLSRKDLVPVFQNVLTALNPGGHVFLSMKQGQTDRVRDGRSFTLWQDAELRPVFETLGLAVMHFSVNSSILGTGEAWLAYVLKDKG